MKCPAIFYASIVSNGHKFNLKFEVMSDNLTAIFIITGVCVILPAMIVWLVSRARSVAVNRKYDLLHAAIEKGVEIDPNLLIDSKKEKRSIKMQLLDKLQWGIILLLAGIITGVYSLVKYPESDFLWLSVIAFAIGVALVVIYFFGKRDLKHEIEQEESQK